MKIEINGGEYTLKYTFNSFKYMEDFDISVFEELERKPFKIAVFTEMLLMGALNHDPKLKIPVQFVQNYLENYVVENSLNTLLEELMALLQNSNFFKSLQKTE